MSDIIEAAVRKLNEKAPVFMPMEALVEIASMVVTTVTPLIEANTLERAAKVTEEYDRDGAFAWMARDIAAAIRALIPSADESI